MEDGIYIRRKSRNRKKISFQEVDVEALQPFQVIEVTNECIDFGIFLRGERFNEMTSDKAGSARDEDFHGLNFMKIIGCGQTYPDINSVRMSFMNFKKYFVQGGQSEHF